MKVQRKIGTFSLGAEKGTKGNNRPPVITNGQGFWSNIFKGYLPWRVERMLSKSFSLKAGFSRSTIYFFFSKKWLKTYIFFLTDYNGGERGNHSGLRKSRIVAGLWAEFHSCFCKCTNEPLSHWCQPGISSYHKFTARTLLFVISSSLHNQADLEKLSYDLLSKWSNIITPRLKSTN